MHIVVVRNRVHHVHDTFPSFCSNKIKNFMNTPNDIPPSKRRRSGKIARFPVELRNLINQSLRNGHTYPVIAHRLNNDYELDEFILPENIGQWSRGGYREWLKQQEQFERSHPRSLEASALLGQITPDGAPRSGDLCENLILNLITQGVQDLDPQTLKTLFASDPDAFFRLTDRLAKLIAQRTRRQHANLEARKFDHVLHLQKQREEKDRHAELRRLGRDDAMNQILAARAEARASSNEAKLQQTRPNDT